MTLVTDYLAPSGLRTRGTVVVVPGRGETRAAYERFGSRLAYDAYRVRVTEPVHSDPAGVTAFLCELAHQLSRAVTGLTDEQPGGLVRPLVLAGSDLGAAGVAALMAGAKGSAVWWPEAVVLAGLPGYGAQAGDQWEDELDVRTHCPVHRAVLTGDSAMKRGELARVVPAELLDVAYESTADVPHLLLVGEADQLADRAALARAAKTLPRARLAVVRGAHHDVLNDLPHRSVAGEVVTFLEALRNELAAAISVEASAW
jgi:pimeloyl-ACP methyl ester carboxylesterase